MAKEGSALELTNEESGIPNVSPSSEDISN